MNLSTIFKNDNDKNDNDNKDAINVDHYILQLFVDQLSILLSTMMKNSLDGQPILFSLRQALTCFSEVYSTSFRSLICKLQFNYRMKSYALLNEFDQLFFKKNKEITVFSEIYPKRQPLYKSILHFEGKLTPCDLNKVTTYQIMEDLNSVWDHWNVEIKYLVSKLLCLFTKMDFVSIEQLMNNDRNEILETMRSRTPKQAVIQPFWESVVHMMNTIFYGDQSMNKFQMFRTEFNVTLFLEAVVAYMAPCITNSRSLLEFDLDQNMTILEERMSYLNDDTKISLVMLTKNLLKENFEKNNPNVEFIFSFKLQFARLQAAMEITSERSITHQCWTDVANEKLNMKAKEFMPQVNFWLKLAAKIRAGKTPLEMGKPFVSFGKQEDGPNYYKPAKLDELMNFLNFCVELFTIAHMSSIYEFHAEHEKRNINQEASNFVKLLFGSNIKMGQLDSEPHGEKEDNNGVSFERNGFDDLNLIIMWLKTSTKFHTENLSTIYQQLLNENGIQKLLNISDIVSDMENKVHQNRLNEGEKRNINNWREKFCILKVILENFEKNLREIFNVR